ncbi:MAG: leucine-rich repeat domain-containing protein [Paludibacteraceae bacterium]|nr:leucine-rich repeat domain-containing protein [Paludibacteraceae bacterium]
MKQIKFLFALCALVAGTLTAWADDSGSCGTNVTYVYTESDHTLTISGTGAMTDYSHSSTAPWYSERNNITKVVIESGVTSIGMEAFNGCTALNDITIPSSVTSILNSAFFGCTSLATINIPSSVNTIENGAFEDCTGLTDLYVNWISTPLPTPGITAFSDVTEANATLHVPAGKKYIYEAAARWKNFTNIVSPYSGVCGASGNIENVTWVFDPATHTLTISGTGAMTNYNTYGGAWRDYKNDIQHVVIEDGVTTIGSDAFYQYTNLETVSLGSDLTNIENAAFFKCTGLTSMTIPSSVNNIGNSTFSQCSNLEDLYVSWTSLSGLTTDAGAFSGLTLGDINLHVPVEAVALYATTTPWKNFNIVCTLSANEDSSNGGTYYSTFYYSNYPFTLGDFTEAYVAKIDGENLNLIQIAGPRESIACGVAVILKATSSSITLSKASTTDAFSGDNDLQGVDNETLVSSVVASGSTCYVLSGGTEGVGFYTYASTKTLKAHKAYLAVAPGSPAPKRLKFVFNSTQNIEQPASGSTVKDGKKIFRDGVLYIERGEHTYNAQGQIVR